MKASRLLLKQSLVLLLGLMALLVVVRIAVETRYIPSTAMAPTLVPGDRIVVYKLASMFSSEYKRGEVILFYPPASELGLKRLHFDWLHFMGTLTGLTIFRQQPLFIKRVIAVAGETVEVKPGEGVFVNGRLLPEPYVAEPASYRLKELADLGGENALGATIQPHAGQKKAIVVPPGTCFVLGDNRNQSADSHVFGFVPAASIMGRAVVRFYPDIKDLSPPEYKMKDSL